MTKLPTDNLSVALDVRTELVAGLHAELAERLA
jgi:hypothetical protein